MLLSVPGTSSTDLADKTSDVVDSQSQSASHGQQYSANNKSACQSCNLINTRSHDQPSHIYPVQHCSNSKYVDTIDKIDEEGKT